MPANQELEVSVGSPVPAGYHFVPRGNVYITGNCRKKTHAAGATLYVVVDPKARGRATVKGIRVPYDIYQEVVVAEQQTRAKRAAQVQAKDDAGSRTFEAEVRRLFPHAPAASVNAISRHALVKRSRRVGRSGKIDLEKKARLAVVAHIRHAETDYDELLKNGDNSREDARRQTWPRTRQVADQWAGRQNSLTADAAGRRISTPSRPGRRSKHGAREKPGKGAQKDKRHNKSNNRNRNKSEKQTKKPGKSDKRNGRAPQPAAVGGVSAKKDSKKVGTSTKARSTSRSAAACPQNSRLRQPRGKSGAASNTRGTRCDKRDTLEVADDNKDMQPSGDDAEEEAEFSDDSEYHSSELDAGSEEEAQFTDYESFDSDDMDSDLD